MLYVAFCLTVTLTIYSLFVVREERSKKLKRRLALVTGASTEAGPKPGEKSQTGREGSPLRRLVLPVWREFRRGFGRFMEERKVAKLELKLLQAGRPFGMSPVDYRIAQLSLLVGLPALFIFYGYMLGVGFGEVLLLALLGIGIAGFLPGYYLRMKTSARSRLALRELPDVLDLLTVSLEAGLGFDAALHKLIAKKQGVLADEFHRCLEEIRLGKTRREALSGVRDRLALDELRVLISSILQAEKLGIGMVQVLRVQSQEVRDQRKQRAEEAAMKAPIKMLFPLVLFIFPTLFIVLLGPAAIQVIEEFSK